MFTKFELSSLICPRISTLKLILVSYIVLDIILSFCQYYYSQLDGDLAACVLPDQALNQLFNDPFGFQAFIEQRVYFAPNRFFIHYLLKIYFEFVPIFIQKFTTPLNSIYLSCAIIKIIVHIGMLLVICLYIFGKIDIKCYKTLFTIAFGSVFFQYNGFKNNMGIIDSSITYFFFYALSIFFYMIILLPFILKYFHNKFIHSYKNFQFLLFAIMFIIINLSGPLIPGINILLIISLLIFSIFNNSNNLLYKINKHDLLVLAFSFLCSIYSLYIGRFNSENLINQISLFERFKVLPEGLFFILFSKLAWVLIILTLIINVVILKREIIRNSKINIDILIFILIFVLLYIIFLPFGGYRSYRPLIIRYDVFIPITILIFSWILISTLSIIKYLNNNKLSILYKIYIIFIISLFTFSDLRIIRSNNYEYLAIQQIQSSKETIVKVTSNSTVLNWTLIKTPEKSKTSIEFLQKLNVLIEDKLFYQE